MYYQLLQFQNTIIHSYLIRCLKNSNIDKTMVFELITICSRIYYLFLLAIFFWIKLNILGNLKFYVLYYTKHYMIFKLTHM